MSASVQWDDTRAKAAVADALNVGVEAAAISIAETARSALREKNYPTISSPGHSPSTDQGGLVRSVVNTPAVDGVSFVGTNLKYGRVLEFGGIITPSRSKYLTVPMIGRTEWRQLIRRGGGSLRGVPGIFVFRSRRGNLILGRTVGKGKASKLEPVAALKKASVIQPRPWLYPSVNKGREQALQRMKQAAMARMKDLLGRGALT